MASGRPSVGSLITCIALLLHSTLIPSSVALPISAPDVGVCHLPFNLPDEEIPFNCCAPSSDKPPRDFQFDQNTSQPFLRIRRPAHAVDQEYAEKLSLAYKLMKALPLDDPRSFSQQANIHCAYCNAVYTEPNTTTQFQVHSSWLFFPFHRWYLYFHERILAKLLGDDTFALPFWNYDHPNGSTIPQMYIDYPELTDQFREPSDQPPSVVTLTYPGLPELPTVKQLQVNREMMYRVMVSGATTQNGFFGQPLRSGDDTMPGPGTVENSPHNTVHLWTGESSQIGWKDMGSFYAAARDPIFYAHHSSIDRLWDVWKSIDQGNKDIEDPDYLESGFAFYNEDAELVHVKVKDSLDSSKLGYTYEDVENLWMKATPVVLSNGTAELTENTTLCTMGEVISEPCSILVARDNQGALTGEETLVIEGIEVQARDRAAHFDVFLNLPTSNESTTVGCTEYAGSFSSLPQFATDSRLQTSLVLGISFNVRELNLMKEDSLVVTLVPGAGSPISILGVRTEYECIVQVGNANTSYDFV